MLRRRARRLTLTVPDCARRDADHDDTAPSGHRLRATIVVNATAMQLEAFLLVPDADPQRTFADDDIALIHHAVAGDGPWETTTIRGRRYVLVATPYCL